MSNSSKANGMMFSQGIEDSKEFVAMVSNTSNGSVEEKFKDANRINEEEKTITLKQAIKKYPKAIFWSVVISSSLIMEGFDLATTSSLYALPAFKKDFGIMKNGKLEVTAAWQTGLSMCSNVGEIIGLQAAGFFADRYGFRKTLGTSLIAIIGFIFIVFFAPSLPVLAIGEILLGTCFGCFQTMAVNYASDVCPTSLRYYLTTYINICWCFGQLIAAGVLKAMESRTDRLAYKIPFALQWMWPMPILIGLYFAPESPWFLIKRNRFEEAKVATIRLLNKTTDNENLEETAEQRLNFMRLTIELEENNNKHSSYKACFKGVNLRRTEITVMAWLMQNECGNALMAYSSYFYEQAGMSSSYAFTFTIIQYVFGIVGCFSSWFAIKYAGRFTIYFYGLLSLGTLMFIVGCLGIESNNNANIWAIGSLLLIFVFIYDLTLGPVCYAIVSEMASSKLRIKTVIISRNIYNLGGIFNAIVTPYMLNPQAWNWGAKTGFFWAGSCFLGCVWAWFRLPETKSRTFAELDRLFQNRVTARKFKQTTVFPFEQEKIPDDYGGSEKQE